MATVASMMRKCRRRRRQLPGRWRRSPLVEKAEKLEQLRVLENGYKMKIGITEYDSTPVDTREDVEKVTGEYGEVGANV